jgi:exopolysaccharide biosynthesis polyprenyl glycosylphosphotransferase
MPHPLPNEERLQLASHKVGFADREIHAALGEPGQTLQSSLPKIHTKLHLIHASNAKLSAANSQQRRAAITAPRTLAAARQGPGLGWTALDYTAALACGFGVILLRPTDWLHTAGSASLGTFTAAAWGIAFTLLTALSTATLSRLIGQHHLRPNRTRLHQQALILLTAALPVLAVAGVAHLWGAFGLSGQLVALNIALTAAVMSLSRTIWRKHVKRGIVTKNFVIAGADFTGREVRDYLTSLAYLGYRFQGFVTLDESAPDTEIPADQILGSLANIIPLSKWMRVHEIIFSKRPPTAALIAALDGARAAGIDVRLVPSVSETLQNRTDVHYVADLPTIVLHQASTRAASLFAKRALDIAAAATGLVATLPIAAAVAIAIKIDSPGPLFYATRRVGFKGRIFSTYKFRTMVSGAENTRTELQHPNEGKHALLKVSDDPSITRVGKFLRKYSLDELPQLWNVLRGDMSMVGPRPPIHSELAMYEIEHLKRLEVTPGITGLWQVESRKHASFDNYIELDRAYASNWSLGLDFSILLRTAKVVLTGTGN